MSHVQGSSRAVALHLSDPVYLAGCIIIISSLASSDAFQ